MAYLVNVKKIIEDEATVEYAYQGSGWDCDRDSGRFRPEVQYISDAEGKEVGVIVPIDLWHEIESERETIYLLKSNNMKRRLLEAKNRQGGISLEDALERLGA